MAINKPVRFENDNIFDADGVAIADFFPETRRFAEDIVRAINAHADLVQQIATVVGQNEKLLEKLATYEAMLSTASIMFQRAGDMMTYVSGVGRSTDRAIFDDISTMRNQIDKHLNAYPPDKPVSAQDGKVVKGHDPEWHNGFQCYQCRKCGAYTKKWMNKDDVRGICPKENL